MENRIRELRQAQGWSQRDVAEKLGVSRQTVNALEAGRWDPSLKLAFQVSGLFQLPIEDLFEPDGK